MRLRVGIVLVLMVGCRAGFDPIGGGDDVPGDAPGDELVATDGPLPDTMAIACPAGYQQTAIAGSKYKAVDDSETWTGAQAACLADGQHLVIFDDAVERSVVTMLLPGRDLWVGVSDRITLGTWTTVTGGAAVYLPWASGEPALDPLERCVEAESPGYALIEQSCSSGRRYICECDGIASDPASY
ncbi:MAG: C-type lectin domain-containing protein [Myxococcota bacterium]|nr:C-type lectin domain-containing protein [Myxococcota bacterium]